MSPHPTSPPHDADQDQRPASVLPHTEPQERADTNPTPTSPDPASGNRAPAPPEEEASHTVSSDQLVGASSPCIPTSAVTDRQAAVFALAGLMAGRNQDEWEAAIRQVASVIQATKRESFGALIDEYYADTLPYLTSEQSDWVSGFFNVLRARFTGSPFTVE